MIHMYKYIPYFGCIPWVPVESESVKFGIPEYKNLVILVVTVAGRGTHQDIVLNL